MDFDCALLFAQIGRYDTYLLHLCWHDFLTGQQIILFACLIVGILPLVELGHLFINLRVIKLLFFVSRLLVLCVSIFEF